MFNNRVIGSLFKQVACSKGICNLPVQSMWAFGNYRIIVPLHKFCIGTIKTPGLWFSFLLCH